MVLLGTLPSIPLSLLTNFLSQIADFTKSRVVDDMQIAGRDLEELNK